MEIEKPWPQTEYSVSMEAEFGEAIRDLLKYGYSACEIARELELPQKFVYKVKVESER